MPAEAMDITPAQGIKSRSKHDHEFRQHTRWAAKDIPQSHLSGDGHHDKNGQPFCRFSGKIVDGVNRFQYLSHRLYQAPLRVLPRSGA